LVEHVKQSMMPMRSSKSEKDGSKPVINHIARFFLQITRKKIFFKGSD